MPDVTKLNLFIQLDLNPDDLWEDARFEARVKDKQSDWTRKFSHPNPVVATEARNNAAAIPQLRVVAANATLREQHAQEARTIRGTTVAQRVSRFAEVLELLQAKRYLTQAEFDSLVADFTDVMTREQVRHKISVPIRSKAKGTTVPVMDRDKFKAIQSILQKLGESDLYHHFGVKGGTEASVATATLLAETERQLKSRQSKSHKDAQDDLVIDLYRRCRDVFTSNAKRFEYDEALRQQLYDELAAAVDVITKHSAEITPEQMDYLLTRARERGLDLALAQESIQKRAKERGAIIFISDAVLKAIAEQQRCGRCGQLNDKGAEFCKACAAPLRVTCPKCQSKVAATDQACSNCGFQTGNVAWVELRLIEADEARKQRDFAIALERLQVARDAWPVANKDELAKKIDKAAAEIQRVLREQTILLEKMEKAIGDRHFGQAQKLLPTLRQILPVQDEQIERYTKLVEEKLGEAKKLLSTIKVGIADSEKLHIYEGTLKICADYDDGKLANETQTLKDKIEATEQEKATRLKAIQQAAAKRRLYEARSLLNTYETHFGKDKFGEIKAHITQGIERAERCVTSAQALIGRNPEQVVVLCMQALTICVDCDAAKDLLAQTPPIPPSQLQAVVHPQLVNLSWQESPSPGVQYLVRRKYGARPISSTDGEQLKLTPNLFFEDDTIEVGKSAFYAVYAERGDVRSAQGAILDKPIMRIAPVSKVVKFIDEKGIRLKWEPPANVHDVVVRRSRSDYPRTPMEGQPVKLLNDREAVDSKIEPDERYFFSLFAVFQDYEKKPVTASAAYVEIVAKQPPTPITHLEMSMVGRADSPELLLRWDPPKQGQVLLLHTLEPCHLSYGHVIPQAELRRHGRTIATSGNQHRIRIAEFGQHYFWVVVVWEEQAYIGAKQEFTHVSEANDLRIEKLEEARQLHLRWLWPANANETELSYSHLDWPGEDHKAAKTFKITKRQYELRGYWEIEVKQPIDYFVVVRTVVNVGGQRLHAPGLSPGARAFLEWPSPLVLEYELEKSGFLGHTTGLRLRLLRGTGKVPALLLVAQQHDLPRNKNDGETLLYLAPELIQETSWRFDLNEVQRPGWYVRLFLERDLYQVITIRHPNKAKSKMA